MTRPPKKNNQAPSPAYAYVMPKLNLKNVRLTANDMAELKRLGVAAREQSLTGVYWHHSKGLLLCFLASCVDGEVVGWMLSPARDEDECQVLVDAMLQGARQYANNKKAAIATSELLNRAKQKAATPKGQA